MHYSLLKEVAYYKEEVKENELKLEEMKSSDKDSYDIKRFEQVLGESYMMVPDSTKRLQQALDDLSSFIAADADSLDTTGEWLQTAKQLLLTSSETCPAAPKLGGEAGDFAETSVDDLADGEAF